MTSVTKRNIIDPMGEARGCSYTRHKHHPLGWIFLQGKNMIFLLFFIFSESTACIKFWIFISYQTEHIVAIIVLPTYFQHPAPASHMWLKISFLDKGKIAKINPKITKIEIQPNRAEKWQIHEIKVLEAIFGECSNCESGLRILIWPLEVPFFGSQRWALLAKVPVFGPQKMALRVPQSKF